MIGYFKGVPNGVHNIGHFACVAHQMQVRYVKFQLVIQIVLLAVSHAQDHVVRQKRLLTLRGLYKHPTVFKGADRGIGDHRDFL